LTFPERELLLFELLEEDFFVAFDVERLELFLDMLRFEDSFREGVLLTALPLEDLLSLVIYL
jgi:hypothetical protein